jgi:hypothetical protein
LPCSCLAATYRGSNLQRLREWLIESAEVTANLTPTGVIQSNASDFLASVRVDLIFPLR